MNKHTFHNVLKNIIITTAILALTTLASVFLCEHDNDEIYIPLLYVLGVLLVSRFTDGYVYGIIAAVLAVLGVNYVFTYPYMAFNFSISGYPMTFAIMLIVSVITSTLTTRMKYEEKVKLESYRNKLRADLFRSVSHDLRTPLTSIYGSVGAILAEPDMRESKRNELLNAVQKDADWLIRMVENLLSVTRMGAEAHIEKDLQLAEEVVADAAGKFRKRYPEIALSLSVPDEPLFVPIDAILIEQVISNLLENAVIHGKTTKKIELRVRAADDRVLFIVTDDGEGINAAAMQRLFASSVDGSRRLVSAGEKRNLGIGLSVCMTIVKAHGGDMRADNLPAGGARFSFWLPMK